MYANSIYECRLPFLSESLTYHIQGISTACFIGGMVYSKWVESYRAITKALEETAVIGTFLAGLGRVCEGAETQIR